MVFLKFIFHIPAKFQTWIDISLFGK